MTILIRSARGIASAMLSLVRLSPRVLPLALVSVIGLSCGRTTGADLDGDGEEVTRSVVYRHYI